MTLLGLYDNGASSAACGGFHVVTDDGADDSSAACVGSAPSVQRLSPFGWAPRIQQTFANIFESSH